ncbi:MAG TPA: PEP-CTERM sorting domain-containing protein [Tepidisphaeraceae bacterium]
MGQLAKKRALSAKLFAPVSAVAATLICLGSVSVAHGAAETALKEANTSIGVLPTNATNKWKLITDPVVNTPAPVTSPDSSNVMIDPSQYLVVGGVLANTYDASMFHLLQDSSGNYATGVSVEGVLPYEILGFDVLMKNGGSIDVEVNSTNHAVDTITDVGDIGGGELGEVDDIQFSLIGDLRSEALTANLDQNFFDLVLIDNDGVTGPPTTGTVIGGPGGQVDLGPIDPTDPNVVPITVINPMSVPEPTSASLVLLSAGVMALRRHKSAKI